MALEFRYDTQLLIDGHDLDEDDFLDDDYPKQLEKIGHTPVQVLVGATIGILISLAFFYLYK